MTWRTKCNAVGVKFVDEHVQVIQEIGQPVKHALRGGVDGAVPGEV